MKTQEDLTSLKKEIETVNRKLAGLSKDELVQISGGTVNQSEIYYCKYCSEWTFQTWIGVGRVGTVMEISTGVTSGCVKNATA